MRALAVGLEFEMWYFPSDFFIDRLIPNEFDKINTIISWLKYSTDNLVATKYTHKYAICLNSIFLSRKRRK